MRLPVLNIGAEISLFISLIWSLCRGLFQNIFCSRQSTRPIAQYTKDFKIFGSVVFASIRDITFLPKGCNTLLYQLLAQLDNNKIKHFYSALHFNNTGLMIRFMQIRQPFQIGRQPNVIRKPIGKCWTNHTKRSVP